MLRAALVAVLLVSLSALAQLTKITIAAGTPEDRALQTIANETDDQKKLAFYQNFVQEFSSNPMAVAYGNWQISQFYQSAGDLDRALAYGDRALEARPNDLDILVSQANIASQKKSNGRIVEYAARGGKAYNDALHATKPAGMSDQEFDERMEDSKQGNKSSYEFLETAAFNAIADEKEAKTRMSFIERFTPAFPASRFEEQVTQYAMFTLGQLNDSPRLFAYGERALAANPSSIPTLLLLANAYVDDTRPGSIDKAVTYAQKVVELAKADEPGADKSRKLSAGVARSTLGYAYAKQDKAADAIPELKAAADLLNGQDAVQFATALYRLGWAYAKSNQIPEAKSVLEEAVKLPGPVQQPARDLLNRINTARPPKAK